MLCCNITLFDCMSMYMLVSEIKLCPSSVVSCRFMLCYVMLCYVMLCYVMLRYVTLRYVTLRYVTLRYVMLCYVMLCYVMLCYVMLCYVMIQCVALSWKLNELACLPAYHMDKGAIPVCSFTYSWWNCRVTFTRCSLYIANLTPYSHLDSD